MHRCYHQPKNVDKGDENHIISKHFKQKKKKKKKLITYKKHILMIFEVFAVTLFLNSCCKKKETGYEITQFN